MVLLDRTILILLGGITIKTYRKDRKPEDTIFAIRDILNSLGLLVIEKSWKNFDNQWYSVRLDLEGLPQLGVNGKGKSERLALASAYGELMERLQSRYMFKSNYGMKVNPETTFINEKIVSTEEIIKMEDIISSLFNEQVHDRLQELLENNSKYRTTCLGYDLTDQVEVELPINLIEAVAGSNGLCAGNTPEEALVQGICEVFERYVHREIFKRKLTFPTIPDELLQAYDSYMMVEKIREHGYKVLVKDCTMEGKYPVVGLLIIDPSRTRYFFKLGSDPDFNIALERCVTEMFQGIQHDDDFEQIMALIDWKDEVGSVEGGFENNNEPNYQGWIKTLKNNVGQYPLSIFIESDQQSNFSPFIKTNFSNQEALDLIINTLAQDEKKIYIIDYSYLGFPSFRVYIPGLTECSVLSDQDLLYREKEDWLRKIILNLKDSSEAELSEFMTVFEEVKESPNYKFKNILNLLSGLILRGKSSYFGLEDDFFSAICWFKLGNFEKAYQYLGAHIEKQEGAILNANYFISILTYFRLKSQGKSLKEIRALLKGLNEDEIAAEWLQDFEDYENALSNLETVTCPNCEECEIQFDCCYPAWKKLHHNLEEKERAYVRTYSFAK